MYCYSKNKIKVTIDDNVVTVQSTYCQNVVGYV